ncbi:MAG: hypothetical protein ABI211_03915 [Vicinamibacterales bacterium]
MRRRIERGIFSDAWGIDDVVKQSPIHRPVFGIAELILGGLVIVGVWRRDTFPRVGIIAGDHGCQNVAIDRRSVGLDTCCRSR